MEEDSGITHRLLPCTCCLNPMGCPSRGREDVINAWRWPRTQQHEAPLLCNGHRTLWEKLFHVGKTEVRGSIFWFWRWLGWRVWGQALPYTDLCCLEDLIDIRSVVGLLHSSGHSG